MRPNLLCLSSLCFALEAGSENVVANDRISQLEVPSNWTEISGPDRNAAASIQYGNILGEKFAMVISESKAEVNEGYDKSFSIDDFTELATQGMTAQGFKVGLTKNVTVNGLPGRRLRVDGEVEGLPIVYVMTILEGDSNFHQCTVGRERR